MTTQPVAVAGRVERRYELTRLQTEVWSSQRLYPHAPLANMATAHRISGSIDPDRFVDAFDRVVRTCDVLRTVIGESPDEASRTRGSVLASPPQRTTVIDLDPTDLDSWMAERIGRPLDVRVCCYDSVLLRHGDDDWTWWLDLHHLVTDATSQTLVHRLTSLAYDGEDIERSSYADFADEQAARLVAGTATSTAVAAEPPLQPFGPRRSTTTSSTRRPVHVHSADPATLPAVVAEAYPSISPDLSLAALFAAALACTMQRLDGRSEFRIGLPVGNRSDRRRRDLVGPLMELHPVAVAIQPDDTFDSLVRRTLGSVIDMLRATRRDPNERRGDFEMVVNVFRGEYETFSAYPVSVTWVRAPHVDPAHSVRVHAFDYGNDLEIELDVNEAFGSGDTPARLDRYVERVVDAMLAEPSTPIADFSIVADDDREQLAALVPAPPDGRIDRPVHESIADRLWADPDRVVAEDRNGAVHAADFDHRVERCRAWLQAAGVVPGDRVGVRMGRSVDVLVAIQAVLRAGAAFVMLDPDDPESRHAAIAADADLRTILDELPPSDDVVGERAEPVPVDLDATAYVLYTSGSTGLPKGVPISHRGLADYLDFAVDAYCAEREPPVVALHSALIFDLTITSLFLSFVTGGSVIVFDGDPVVALGRIATDDRITFLKATPSQLEIFARMVDTPRRIDTVVVGGEAFRRPVAVATARVVLAGRADLQRVRADRSGRGLHDPRVGSGHRHRTRRPDRPRSTGLRNRRCSTRSAIRPRRGHGASCTSAGSGWPPDTSTAPS